MTKSEEMKRLEADMASDKELGKKFYETVDRIATENDQQSDGELFARQRSSATASLRRTSNGFTRRRKRLARRSSNRLREAARKTTLISVGRTICAALCGTVPIWTKKDITGPALPLGTASP